MAHVEECKLINMTRIQLPKGNLTPVYNDLHIPFSVRRIYYLYDIPGGSSRGGHAHKDLQQLIVAASGCFDVIVDDGKNRKLFTLNRSYFGLLIPRMIWREIDNFSTGAICLVLASKEFDESDYIRHYQDFHAVADSVKT